MADGGHHDTRSLGINEVGAAVHSIIGRPIAVHDYSTCCRRARGEVCKGPDEVHKHSARIVTFFGTVFIIFFRLRSSTTWLRVSIPLTRRASRSRGGRVVLKLSAGIIITLIAYCAGM